MKKKDIHTPIFLALLFTTAKMWRQPMCPRIEKWIKERTIYAYIYNTIDYYSPIRKDAIRKSSAMWMDLWEYHAEQN